MPMPAPITTNPRAARTAAAIQDEAAGQEPMRRPAGVMPALAALTAVVAMSQVFRTIAAVIGPGVQREFGLSTEQLGMFAGAFHLAFAMVQIPAGLALDLYGARRTVGLAFVFTIAGAMLSAFAPRFSVLMLGQLLLGVGCGPAFVGALYFCTRHFERRRFAAVSSLVLGFSGLGLLATGTPFAWLVETLGWRAGYLAAAAVAGLVLIAIVTRVHDRPSPDAVDLRSAFAACGAILKMRQTPGIMLPGLVTYASYITLRGLWATPMLVDRHGLSLTQAGHVLLASSIAALIGPPLFGLITADGRRRRCWIAATLLLSALGYAAIAWSPGWRIDVALCISAGLLTGVMILQFADVKDAYPPSATGRAFGVFNTASFLGVALLQWATGVAASAAVAHGVEPYRLMMSGVSLALVTAVAAFVLLPGPAAPTQAGLAAPEDGGRIRRA